jgi:hypothetical protein
MVLHDFRSKRLTLLQDWSGHTWMYTRVNDIMRLYRGPGSSLDEDLLTTSLKALTTDQFSAELVVPPMVCEPICVNQVARLALLAVIPQRGDLSHNVVIPGDGGPGSTVRGHGGIMAGGRGGGPASFGPAGGRGGGPAGDYGGTLAGG